MDTQSLRDTWLMFQREHDCSIDRMLCDPQLRNEYVRSASHATGMYDERQILWSTVGLRKRKQLPTRLRDSR